MYKSARQMAPLARSEMWCSPDSKPLEQKYWRENEDCEIQQGVEVLSLPET